MTGPVKNLIVKHKCSPKHYSDSVWKSQNILPRETLQIWNTRGEISDDTPKFKASLRIGTVTLGSSPRSTTMHQEEKKGIVNRNATKQQNKSQHTTKTSKHRQRAEQPPLCITLKPTNSPTTGEWNTITATATTAKHKQQQQNPQTTKSTTKTGQSIQCQQQPQQHDATKLTQKKQEATTSRGEYPTTSCPTTCPVAVRMRLVCG